MPDPQYLAKTLLSVTVKEYVRFVADWLPNASDLERSPTLTRDPVVDALVAAAAEHVSVDRGLPVPAWTQQADRFLDRPCCGSRTIPSRVEMLVLHLPPTAVPRRWKGSFARAWLYRHCLAMTPPSFRRHALIIEKESLVSL